MLKRWEGMEEISVKSSIWWVELHLKNKLLTICLRWWSRCTYLTVVYFDYKVQKVEFNYKEQVLSTGSLWSQVLQLLQPGGVPLFPGANHGAVASWWVRSGNLDMIRRNWNGKKLKMHHEKDGFPLLSRWLEVLSCSICSQKRFEYDPVHIAFSKLKTLTRVESNLWQVEGFWLWALDQIAVPRAITLHARLPAVQNLPWGMLLDPGTWIYGIFK